MPNLIAYIPVLNRRHFDWLSRHKMSDLFLISQEMAGKLVERLERNVGALPTELMIRTIQNLGITRIVAEFAPEWDDPDLRHQHSVWRDWIMPDEDVSHALAEKYLVPAGCNVSFEQIWARYDMQVVKRQEPVIADIELSEREFDRCIMMVISEKAKKSPDWWRQVGAAAVDTQGKILAIAHNAHYPTEYEVDVFGDPALNRDAGGKGASLALHSEQAVIAACARGGQSLNHGFLYVTTFPCDECARLIVASGAGKVFFREGFSSLTGREVLRTAGVQMIRVL